MFNLFKKKKVDTLKRDLDAVLTHVVFHFHECKFISKYELESTSLTIGGKRGEAFKFNTGKVKESDLDEVTVRINVVKGMSFEDMRIMFLKETHEAISLFDGIVDIIDTIYKSDTGYIGQIYILGKLR